MKIALGLVHYPILDARGNIVATNITNLDLHDIARACRVYGIDRYYLIHPMEEQLMFVSRILEHWRIGDGAQYNPMRKTALTMVHTASSLEAAIEDWRGGEGPEPSIVATHARLVEGAQGIRFRELREKIEAANEAANGQANNEERLFLIFGTGYGLTPETMKKCTYLLEPIRGASKDDYRHLSVRSAVSICLDRLLGPW